MTDRSITASYPADGHVHSEWSWDAPNGSMDESCARAVKIGLGAIAFTEHVDHTVWTVDLDALSSDAHLAALASPGGALTPPTFDAEGYLEAIDRCRHRYPDLRILSGVELGEPHWHPRPVARVLATGQFDRVLGSLHCLPFDGGFTEPPGLYARRAATDVVREYLAELPLLVTQSDAFAVVAHVDYPIRYWPENTGRFDPSEFEEEFRYALGAIAGTGRALEINTVMPFHSLLVGWWREEGGQAVTFGSDAHEPSLIARRFNLAVDLATANGFRPGRSPYDFWGRAG